MQIKFFLLPVLSISLAQGCSFSISSESSASLSDSSNSIISSPSSSSSKANEKYQLEIINYTSAYITSSRFDHFAFTRGISEIASKNGITNWEEDEDTLISIGQGLKNANITSSLFEIYQSTLANAIKSRMQMIQKGYDMQ